MQSHSSSIPRKDASSKNSKVASVTGASSGIGLEVAERLLATGYRVVANSRNIASAMTLQTTDDLALVDGVCERGQLG
jgi:NAD(P)-dependent dehydrogenase (short-subunit alcohol dehydrogenase family)